MIFSERRDLLDGFRRGDRAALYEVYRFFVKDVVRFLTRGFAFESEGRPLSFRGFRGGYETEAAVQEVFRRAFEERARLAYDGIHPYRPYLLRIARNAVINDLKSRHPILFRFRVGRPVVIEAESAAAVESDPDLISSPDRTPEEILESEEVQKLVDAFKRSLDERALGVFRCRFEEGLSAEEAGRRLDLTRSQVRTTEAKMRASFLEHMQRSGYLTAYRQGGGAPSAASSAAFFAAFIAMWSMT